MMEFQIKNNSHNILIHNFNYKVYNQLNDNKSISNFYIPKKFVRKIEGGSRSFKIKISDVFIVVPKKMVFLDKTQKYFLVGIDMFKVYWKYNVFSGEKKRIMGYQFTNETDIINLHFASIIQRRFEKEQEQNPFLQNLTYEQARDKILNEAKDQKNLWRKMAANFKNSKESTDDFLKFQKKNNPSPTVGQFLNQPTRQRENIDDYLCWNEFLYQEKRAAELQKKKDEATPIDELIDILDDPIFS